MTAAGAIFVIILSAVAVAADWYLNLRSSQ